MDDSRTSEQTLLRFDEPGTARSVIIEDDGKVAYAYLLYDGKVVGDVWLYNVAATPAVVNWKDSSEMPFLNPKSFCKNDKVERVTKGSSVRCDWTENGVNLIINGILEARLERGSKPGWSRLAARTGPLAKPL